MVPIQELLMDQTDINEIHTTVSGMARQFISNIWYHLSINNWVLNILMIIDLVDFDSEKWAKNFCHNRNDDSILWVQCI